MRCPKCHYISFEDGTRCRNCGYEFSLSTPAGGRPAAVDELPLHDIDATPQPPIDLSFLDAGRAPTAQPAPPALAARAAAPRPAAHPAPDSSDLPLFGRGGSPAAGRREDDDAPLIAPSPVPRAPLSVRRSTPDAQRLRARYAGTESPRLDLEPSTAAVDAPVSQPATPDALVDAPPARRLLAAAIDLVLLGGVNLGVLYFTLKLCSLPLSPESVLELPAVPFYGFLLFIDAGYAITFTAIVGQTIGKMATGLKVVNSDEAFSGSGHPNVGFSILRTAAYAASALPLGLGFLPAFVGHDRRALHDRLAETRVVRA